MQKISEEIKKFVIKNYPNKGAKYCAEKLNLKESQIRSLVSRLKIQVSKTRKSFIARNKLDKPYDQYNVNPLQFMDVKTPEAAYILGFLWADGFLGSHYSINAEIISDDAIVIEEVFLSTGDWHIFQRHRKGYKPQTKFTCNSKMLYEHLIKIGFKEKHKCPNKLLKTIPKKLQHYWFRGFFDGDGCWYFSRQNHLRQCTISSRYDQNWKFLIKLFFELKIKQYNINSQILKNKKNIINKSSQLRLCNLDAIQKFGNYIYSGDRFGLTRKLNKFYEIVE